MRLCWEFLSSSFRFLDSFQYSTLWTYWSMYNQSSQCLGCLFHDCLLIWHRYIVAFSGQYCGYRFIWNLACYSHLLFHAAMAKISVFPINKKSCIKIYKIYKILGEHVVFVSTHTTERFIILYYGILIYSDHVTCIITDHSSHNYQEINYPSKTRFFLIIT